MEIRDCLNFFFPFFAKHCRPWSLQLFENAIIPTMLTLFNAPIHNPLYEVDQKCVIKVLCDIVSPNFINNRVNTVPLILFLIIYFIITLCFLFLFIFFFIFSYVFTLNRSVHRTA